MFIAAVITQPGQCENNNTTTNNSTSETVCLDLIGCLDIGSPWVSVTRPCAKPSSPKEINTKIFFYSDPFPERQHYVYQYPHTNVSRIPFQRKHPTYILIHGNNADGSSSWMHKARRTLIEKKLANVLIVDWGAVTKTNFPLNMLQVCGSARTVALEVATVLHRLIHHRHLNISETHCVGHSFGAHVCGYIGKNFTGQMATITALDACQPTFEGQPSKVRLAKGDARFVMAIHTDAQPTALTGSVGFMAAFADVDIYFNGGIRQPGCIVPSNSSDIDLSDPVKAAKFMAKGVMACSHSRAHAYYTEAISNHNCIFWAHRAEMKNMLESLTHILTNAQSSKFTALSNKCDNPEDCIPLILGMEHYPGRGTFLVTTSGSSPFCIDESVPLNYQEKMDAGSRMYAAVIKALEYITPKSLSKHLWAD